MISLIETSVLVGLLYCLFTVGLALNFRVLNYPDLTLEGSAIFGGAICLTASNAGVNSLGAILLGAAAGAIAGLFTAVQSLYFGVSRLLSGIITTAILYSLAIRVLEGRANALFSRPTVFDTLNPGRSSLRDTVIQCFVVLLVFAVWVLIFNTKIGLLFRAIGDGESHVICLGINPKTVILGGLAFSNAVIGLGGAVLVQYKSTVDVNMVFGVLIGALASLVLGETLFRARRLETYFLSNICGTIIYSFAIAAVLFSWSPQWDRLIMASDVRLIAGLLLIVPSFLKRRVDVNLFRAEW